VKGLQWFKNSSWQTGGWESPVGTLDVSSDGNTYSDTRVFAGTVCSVTSSDQPVPQVTCRPKVTVSSDIVAPGCSLQALEGYAELSRNGRYALSIGYQNTGSLVLYDLTSCQATPVALNGDLLSPTAPRQAVADTGVVLLRRNTSPNVLILRNHGVDKQYSIMPSQEADTASQSNLVAAITDSQAQHVIYAYFTTIGYTPAQWSLRMIDTATSQDISLLTIDLKGNYNHASYISVSADGARIVFLDPSGSAQVLMARSDGSGVGSLISQQVAGDVLTEAVISPDGTLAWVSDGLNRIIRINLQSGVIDEVVPRTPVINNWSSAFVPGSLVSIFGSGLADSSQTSTGNPLPRTLGGVTVEIRDAGSPSAPTSTVLEAPILSVAQTRIQFQIPFEAQQGSRVFVTSLSPFATGSLGVQDLQPSFLQVSPNYGFYGVHQDFRSLVTQQQPAAPGEIVHFYVSGIGPVSPPVATGYQASASPLSSVVQQVQCSMQNYYIGSIPMKVLFAGLAPGMVGIYQMDLQVPQQNSVVGLRSVGIACVGWQGAWANASGAASLFVSFQ
jgi:uncharacterized protein (TIGR03437 family)